VDPIANVLAPASPGDLPALVPYLRAYAEFDGLPFDEERVRRVMDALLRDPGLGRVAFIVDGARRCGYVALCYGYSLELGGRDAFVDELFIEAGSRNRGLGSRALQQASELACADGIVALHLEVRRDNVEAQRYYARHGFTPRDRYFLLSRRLS
jgi:ribosomal protein S18 acetylase RimI-like enzyme